MEQKDKLSNGQEAMKSIKYYQALSSAEKEALTKEAKGGSWYDGWQPYCMMCDYSGRMFKKSYGFQCPHCANMIGFDLKRVIESPLNKEQEVKVCDATKAEATTEAGNKTPSIDYVYVPSELKDIKDDDIILFDNGETRRHSEESWPFAVATHKLKKVPLSSLISKGGAEVEKLAETLLHKNTVYMATDWKETVLIKWDEAKAAMIEMYNQALTKKAGGGWKERIKPCCEQNCDGTCERIGGTAYVTLNESEVKQLLEKQ